MNKIVASLLVFNFSAMLAEEKGYCGLFEKYSKTKPLFSQLSGSDKGAQYFGSLSDEKYPELSLAGYVNYALMRCACKLGYSANFVDEVNGKPVFYTCSRNESDVINVINNSKAILVQPMKEQGEVLIKGDILYFQPVSLENYVPGRMAIKPGEVMVLPILDDSQKHIFVTCVHLNNSDIDTAEFFYETRQKVIQAEYGVHIIGGKLIKITAVGKGQDMKMSKMFPTEQEIAKARSKFSK